MTTCHCDFFLNPPSVLYVPLLQKNSSKACLRQVCPLCPHCLDKRISTYTQRYTFSHCLGSMVFNYLHTQQYPSGNNTIVAKMFSRHIMQTTLQSGSEHTICKHNYTVPSQQWLDITTLEEKTECKRSQHMEKPIQENARGPST